MIIIHIKIITGYLPNENLLLIGKIKEHQYLNSYKLYYLSMVAVDQYKPATPLLMNQSAISLIL